MSVSWAAIEERERDKKEQAKALKDFLKSQNEEIKQRKALEKLNEVQEFQRLYGAPQPQQQQQQPQQQQPRGNGPPLQHTPNATAPPGGHSDMFSYLSMAGAGKAMPAQSTSNASYGRPAVAPQPQRQSQMPSAMSSAGQSSSYSYASQPGGGINASAMAPFNASVGSLNNGGSSMPSSLPPASSYTPSPVSAVSASIGMPSPTTAFSSATAGGSSQPGIAEELLVRLRFTEDQLQQERRSRAWVESELQAGKSLLASLSARVDKLQEQSSAEASQSQALSRLLAESDKRAQEATQQLAARLDRDSVRLHQLVADAVGRHQADDRARQDYDEMYRATSEAITQLRYKLESTLLKANQVGNDFYAKSKDWDGEVRRGADTLRAIKEHEHALASLSTAVEGSSETLGRRLEISVSDIRQRMDADARVRAQFEDHVRGLYGEVCKAMQSQERDMVDRIEGVRGAVSAVCDRDRVDRDRGLAALGDQIRGVERTMRESMSAMVERVSQQLLAANAVLGEERQARKTLETQVQAAVEEGFKIVQQAVTRRTDEMAQQQSELRSSMTLAVKSLQESIVLIEKTSDQKLAAIEDVLRAEIKSRMETDTAVANMAEDVGHKLDLVEKRGLSRLEETLTEVRREQDALDRDIKATAQQLAVTRSRLSDDLDSQIQTVTAKTSDALTLVRDKLKDITASISALETEFHAGIQDTQTQLEKQVDTLRAALGESDLRIQETRLQCQETRTQVDDRLNLKTVQMDATMDAFKTELMGRPSRGELDDMQRASEQQLSTLRESVSALQAQIGVIKDARDTLVSRSQMTEMELGLKSSVAAAVAKAVHVEDRLIAMSETVASHVSRADLADAEERAKAVLHKAQERDAEMRAVVERVRLDLGDRATKTSLDSLEERMSGTVREALKAAQDVGCAVAGVRESVAGRPTRDEMAKVVKDMETQIAVLATQVEAASARASDTADQVHRDVDTGLQRLTETLDTRLDSTEARFKETETRLDALAAEVGVNALTVTERLAEHATLSADRDAQHKEIVSTLKDLLHAQVSSLSLRLDDITPEIARLDTKADGILSSVSQSITAHTAATDKSIADLRKTVATKLTASDHDRYKSEAQQQADKLAAKQEISMLAIDQVRLRLGDNEAVAKQRWQAVLDSQTRSTADAMDALKGVRETLGARLSDLETRVLDDIPRVLDDCRAETRRCTTDTRDTALGLHELAKQVQRLDDRRGGDTDTAAITGVVSTVRALDDRLGRLAADIADLRSDMERLRLRVRSPSPHRGRDHAVVRDSPPPPQPPPQQPQSSFYKPVLRTYSQRVLDGTASPPPWPASGSSTKSQPMLARAGSPPPADPGPTSQSQSQSRSQSPPVQPSLPGNLRRLPSPPTEY